MKRFKYVAKNNIFSMILLSVMTMHFFVYADNTTTSDQSKKWTLAFSEFDLENIPDLYSSYATLVPKLLKQYLNTEAYRVIPIEEKKARQLLNLFEKKLKAVYELNELVLKKDKLFLSNKNLKEKAELQRKLEEDIERKKTEIDFLQADINIENLKVSYPEITQEVVLWENDELFTRDKNAPIAVDLHNNQIDALVTGIIKNVSGYIVITVNLQTGLKKEPEITIFEAGKYQDVEVLAQNLSTFLYAKLQSLKERKLYIELQPKTASVFINDNEVLDLEKPISVYTDEIKVFASAEGFDSVSKNFKFGSETSYKLKINLPETEKHNVQLKIPNNTKVFTKTQKLQETKNSNEIPVENKKNVYEFVNENGVRTFVIIDPENLKVSDSVKEMQSHLNTEPAKSKIEKQRSIMYWSLAGVYISLPATLILAGIRNDKINSYNANRIPQTTENAIKIKNLNIATNVMIGVTATLAVNYLVQVILYLVNADYALPAVLK